MKNLAWTNALKSFADDGPIYVAGCCGEPTAFLDALEEDPDLARGRTLTGVWIPGVNQRDPTRTGQRKALTSFVTPSLQVAIKEQRANVMPMHYSSTYKWLGNAAGLAGGIFQVSPPRDGTVSLGVSADFTPSVVASKVPLIGQINAAMPEIIDSPRIPLDRFGHLIEAETSLVEYEAGSINEIYAAIGRNVAELIDDADTVQFGLGKLQTAVLAALNNHRSLKLHGGMISPGILTHLTDGSFNHATIGVALGDREFYAQIANEKRISFKPVSFTHSATTLAAIKSFVSVNSILEVDLFGQGNGEFLGETQITGHGGLVDFIRGAALSEQGRSILALPATARQGTISRITPSLGSSVPITINRADIDWIVTEYGAACLKHATIQQRANRLIEIAAPKFRTELANAWEMNCRKGLKI